MIVIDKTRARQRKKLALFKIVDGNVATHFSHKEDAKTARDAGTGLVVMRGPDHWRGESFNRVAG